MEGNCFSEKQRVFVILPKERPWRISADRNTFGGYPISAEARPWRISSEGTPLCGFRYSISAEGTPLADFFKGNAFGGFRYPISADRHTFGGYPISSARNAHGVFLPRERHLVDTLFDFAIRFRYSISLFAIRYSLFAIRYSLFAIRYSLFAIRFLPIGTPLVDFCR
jgi:hypothetical protein